MNTVIDGLNINYEMRGEGDFVLFLHGWGANMTLFEGLMNVVSQKYTALALDMPGFGKSDEPKEAWNVDNYVDFVLKFVDLFKPKSLVLVGHSFGGRVIIKMLARELPFEVRKIILIDAAGIKPKKTLKQKASLAAYKVGRRVMSLKPLKVLFPDAVENMRKKRGSADYNSATPIMRETLVKVVNEDLTCLLPSIKASSLLIWGTADTATPLSDGEMMEKLIPDAGLVKVNGAGHYSFLEAPDLAARVVASFLKIS
ncbi:MAG: alpha/beta hydrolase [Oscillospiraceae bacterium]|nr:alpha/beta hydrolase [Oscillospiraceae bacterium]